MNADNKAWNYMYKCTVCSEIYPSIRMFLTHVKINHDIRNVSCPCCFENLTSRDTTEVKVSNIVVHIKECMKRNRHIIEPLEHYQLSLKYQQTLQKSNIVIIDLYEYCSYQAKHITSQLNHNNECVASRLATLLSSIASRASWANEQYNNSGCIKGILVDKCRTTRFSTRKECFQEYGDFTQLYVVALYKMSQWFKELLIDLCVSNEYKVDDNDHLGRILFGLESTHNRSTANIESLLLFVPVKCNGVYIRQYNTNDDVGLEDTDDWLNDYVVTKNNNAEDVTEPQSSSSLSPPSSPRGETRRRIKSACAECRRKKAGCDFNRPCQRCIKSGAICRDTIGQKRCRKKSNKEKPPTTKKTHTNDDSLKTIESIYDRQQEVIQLQRQELQRRLEERQELQQQKRLEEMRRREEAQRQEEEKKRREEAERKEQEKVEQLKVRGIIPITPNSVDIDGFRIGEVKLGRPPSGQHEPRLNFSERAEHDLKVKLRNFIYNHNTTQRSVARAAAVDEKDLSHWLRQKAGKSMRIRVYESVRVFMEANS